MIPESFAEGIMPTYLPSTLWMKCLGIGIDLKTRDYARTRILSNTQSGILLTVPVAGGSSATKRLRPASLKISDHGDWPRLHLGALDAAYGKEPYFQHLFPEIASEITGYPKELSTLNRNLMTKMMVFLDYETLMPEIRNLRNQYPRRCESIADKLRSKIDPEHSFLEPLFRFGRDALFLLD